MVSVPENRLEFNKDGTDFMLWDLHAKTGAKRTYIIPKDKITSIQFEKETVRKLFKKIDTEVITIVTKIRFEPFLIYGSDEPKYFEEYKEELRSFCKKNMVTLRERT